MVALPAAAGTGALVGGVAAGVALRRHHRGRSLNRPGTRPRPVPSQRLRPRRANRITTPRPTTAAPTASDLR
jgi:hypothetical protein